MPAARRYILRLSVLALVALAVEAPSALGQTFGDDYFTLLPCRIYDTRTPVHDPLRGGPDRRREIQVSGVCEVPAGAAAVAINLTGVDASRAGSLAVYSADLATALEPYYSLALPAGRTRANNAIVEVSSDGKLAAELSADFAGPEDTADLIVDVLGYFFEYAPAIRLVKRTNGDDANSPPGPAIPVGNPVRWEYVVANLGNLALTDVEVTDDRGVAVSCPKTSLQSGESMTCTGNGVARACQYSNIGSVMAKAPEGETVGDNDPSHYFGDVQGSISIRKATNGFDANDPPGPEIPAGSHVSWTYIVKNTGGGALTSIKVTDNQGVAVSCPKTSLAAGESMTCFANGTAVACQYANMGNVTAKTQCGSEVTAEDPSHYFGTPCP